MIDALSTIIIFLEHFLEAQGRPAMPAFIREDNQSSYVLPKQVDPVMTDQGILPASGLPNGLGHIS